MDPQLTPRSTRFSIPQRNRQRQDSHLNETSSPSISVDSPSKTPRKSVSFPRFRKDNDDRHSIEDGLPSSPSPSTSTPAHRKSNMGQGEIIGMRRMTLSMSHGDIASRRPSHGSSSASASDVDDDEEETRSLSELEEGKADVPVNHEGTPQMNKTSNREKKVKLADSMDLGQMSTPRRRKKSYPDEKHEGEGTPETGRPPSFARSEFETIVRRLRNKQSHLKRGGGKGNGHGGGSSRSRLFPNSLAHDWQFAGWGSLSYIDLPSSSLIQAQSRLHEQEKKPKMGEWAATSIAGNAVLGSVFYASPAICTVSGIYSPICMTVACCILFLFRPIMLELGGAMRLDGANYRYLLNVSSKSMALLGAAITLIDAVATGVVSAATASSYISGETTLPFPDLVLAIVILVAFTGMLMLGVRESSAVTLGICGFHCLTMLALFIAAVVHWGKEGNAIISSNWSARPVGGASIAKSIFDGICIGLLGVTGFESTPAFIAQIRESAYKPVLRNLIFGALAVNIPILTVIYACLPNETILGGANVLSALGGQVAGSWLSKVVVVDSFVVLCGGVLTGAVTTCSVVEGLAADRALPAVFGKALPKTGAFWMACLLYLALCIVIYAASGFSLAQSSNLFSMSFMAVLLTFAISAMLLKFNRDRLKRSSSASVATLMAAILVMIVVLAGNVAQAPIILLLFGVVLVVMLLMLHTLQRLAIIYEWSLYVFEHVPTFRKWKWTKHLDQRLIAGIKGVRRAPVCVWVKEDDISQIIDLILYVRNNEQTARIVLIHAYSMVEEIPSELEANTKLCDEAFPDITIDLALVQGEFNPALVEAVSAELDISKNLMFIGTLTSTHLYSLADYHGARVIRG